MSRNSKIRQQQKHRRDVERDKRRRKKTIKLYAGQPWRAAMVEAQQCLVEDNPAAAENVLTEYDKTHPPQSEVLHLLLDVLNQQRKYAPYCAACSRLMKIEPNNASLHLMLGHGHLAGARIALGLQALHRYLAHWPDDPLQEGVRDTIDSLEPELKNSLRELPFDGPDWLDWAALLEETTFRLGEADCAGAIACGERLLAAFPKLVPALNNLSLAYFHDGRPDRSIELSRRVLELEPDNFHALGNLSQQLLLTGRPDEARDFCARLKSISSPRNDIWHKKVETFSYFGDDEAVLAAFHQGRKAGALNAPPPESAMFLHLAGVAAARKGECKAARGYWREAIAVAPWYQIARDNLADFDRPAGKRNGPWPFNGDHWIAHETFDAVVGIYNRHDGDDDDGQQLVAAMAHFAAQHPEVTSLIPVLLDRGDRFARRFSIAFAMGSQTPEMLAALRNFCQSQRGTDEERTSVANFLARQDFIKSDRIPMWIKGQQTEIELCGWEITSEPTGPVLSGEVNDWAFEANEALHANDGVRAEALLKRCIAKEGETPALLNNLAMAYAIQGCHKESEELRQQILNRWPDYFFGIVALANVALRDGKLDLADEHLAKLRKRKRMHLTEFAALAAAYIRLFGLRGDAKSVRSWLNMWKEIDPDDPQIAEYESLLSPRSPLGKLARLFSRDR